MHPFASPIRTCELRSDTYLPHLFSSLQSSPFTTATYPEKLQAQMRALEKKYNATLTLNCNNVHPLTHD